MAGPPTKDGSPRKRAEANYQLQVSRNAAEGLSNEIETIARQDAGCERLRSVPGIGPITSSAMVAAIGAGDVFTKGRDFAGQTLQVVCR